MLPLTKRGVPGDPIPAALRGRPATLSPLKPWMREVAICGTQHMVTYGAPVAMLR
jgi:hypothetical protein